MPVKNIITHLLTSLFLSRSDVLSLQLFCSLKMEVSLTVEADPSIETNAKETVTSLNSFLLIYGNHLKNSYYSFSPSAKQ